MGNLIDLTGHRFGRWTVIQLAPPNGSNRLAWICQCDCGSEKAVQGGNLRSGRSTGCRSCAIRGNAYAGTHGRSNTPTWHSWSTMRARCRTRDRYAGRGICVDPRWLSSFENFLADMGERPPGCSLERIDNDGPYSRENCRWASAKEQANNRHNTVYVTYSGRTQTVSQWAVEVGISHGALLNRVKRGWAVAQALGFEKRL